MTGIENQEYGYDPLVANLRDEIIAEAKRSEHIDSWFLPEHLMEVERLANSLCDQFPEADRDVVGLSVWFHDIGRLRGCEEEHDVYGAQEAKKVLSEKGFPSEKTELVYQACLAHRCKEIKPESLEAKILATADAMSHFSHGFYLRLFQVLKGRMSFGEIRDLVRKKLERDYNDKIFFNQAREEIRERYQALKLIL